MPQFMLLLRDSGAFPETISAEEIQEIIERYNTWRQKVGGTGQKLRDSEGRVMRRENGLTVTDGPFTEAKEVLGGYFLIEADDYDAALKMSEDCPHLDFGSIEIRQIEL